jgi:glycosyltransferase involved in cell wall biosynthesis
MTSVTIAVDARTFYYEDSLARGIGHYSRHHLEALAALRPDWRFTCYGETSAIPSSLQALARRSNVDFHCADDFDPDEADIIHLCDPMGVQRGFDAPLRVFRGGKRYTATFYDLIPLHLYFRAWDEPLRRQYLSRLEQCVNSGATFLAISAYTGMDLIRQTRVCPERVKVIMAGLNTRAAHETASPDRDAEILARFGIRSPFFLHVGALDPHKNFETSAAAFKECRRRIDAQLVVVGQKAGALARMAEHCRAKGQPDIVFTGYIQRRELDILYREAVALLFMSRFEGFGFPVLEAMAAGCPVITSNATSIAEVAGDAAVLLEPGDVAGVCRAMLELVDRPEAAETLRRKGLRQAAGFSWERTAEKTLAAWEELLLQPPLLRKKPAASTGSENGVQAASGRPMRVLLDVSVLGLSLLYESSKTGVYRVVENLARGLASVPQVALTFCSTQHLTEKAPHTLHACRRYLESSRELRSVPFCAGELPEADLFHSPFHALPDAARRFQRFLTVHDLIPWLHPELFAGKAANPVRSLFDRLDPRDRFLCTSRSAQGDLCRHLGVSEDRVHLAPLAADEVLFHPCRDLPTIDRVLRRYGIPERSPYFLSLGTIEPRKNLEGVLRAFARLAAAGRVPGCHLVLVGTRGWGVEGILRTLQENAVLKGRVILTGFVADRDLAALYSGALAFLYLSHYEGFGLPPLEAMRCGTPVIVADNSAMPEVTGDSGIRLESRDVDGIALAMNEVAVNAELRAEMSLRSLRRAAQFSWRRFIDQTLAAYQAALPGGALRAGL